MSVFLTITNSMSIFLPLSLSLSLMSCPKSSNSLPSYLLFFVFLPVFPLVSIPIPFCHSHSLSLSQYAMPLSLSLSLVSYSLLTLLTTHTMGWHMDDVLTWVPSPFFFCMKKIREINVKSREREHVRKHEENTKKTRETNIKSRKMKT